MSDNSVSYAVRQNLPWSSISSAYQRRLTLTLFNLYLRDDVTQCQVKASGPNGPLIYLTLVAILFSEPEPFVQFWWLVL